MDAIIHKTNFFHSPKCLNEKHEREERRKIKWKNILIFHGCAQRARDERKWWKPQVEMKIFAVTGTEESDETFHCLPPFLFEKEGKKP